MHARRISGEVKEERKLCPEIVTLPLRAIPQLCNAVGLAVVRRTHASEAVYLSVANQRIVRQR